VKKLQPKSFRFVPGLRRRAQLGGKRTVVLRCPEVTGLIIAAIYKSKEKFRKNGREETNKALSTNVPPKKSLQRVLLYETWLRIPHHWKRVSV